MSRNQCITIATLTLLTVSSAATAEEGLYLPEQATSKLQKEGVPHAEQLIAGLQAASCRMEAGYIEPASGWMTAGVAASGFFTTPDLCLIPAHTMIAAQLLSAQHADGFVAPHARDEISLPSLRLLDAANGLIVDGQSRHAKLVAFFPGASQDFAVVRVPGRRQEYLPLSDEHSKGERLIAAGFPDATRRYLAPEQYGALREHFLTAEVRRLSLWQAHFEQMGYDQPASRLAERAEYAATVGNLLEAREWHVVPIYAAAGIVEVVSAELGRLEGEYAHISAVIQAIETAFEYAPALAARAESRARQEPREEDRQHNRAWVQASLEQSGREPAALMTVSQHLTELGELKLAQGAERLAGQQRDLQRNWEAALRSGDSKRIEQHPFTQFAGALAWHSAAIEIKGQELLARRSSFERGVQTAITPHCPYPEVIAHPPSLRVSIGEAIGAPDGTQLASIDGREGMSGSAAITPTGKAVGFLVAGTHYYSEWTCGHRCKLVPGSNVLDTLHHKAPHVAAEIRGHR